MSKDATPFRLWPLAVETFVSTVAVMSFVALVGPLSRTLGLAEWQAGATVTGAGMAMVLFSRAWGTASDRHGRRRVLLVGVVGFALAYAALSAAIVASLVARPSPWLVFSLFFVLRTMAGGFYAAVPSTGAALVADHVDQADRAKTMAKLGAASAAGMLVGPGMTGSLASYGLSVPLYVTALLPAGACVVLWRTLPNEAPRGREDARPLRLTDPRLRRPLVTAFVATSSVIVAQVSVGFYAIDRLRCSEEEGARVAGIVLTSVGVALILSQVLVQKLAWPPLRLIRVGGSVAAVGFLAVAWADRPLLLYASYFVAGAGMGWVFPSMSALAANAVQAHEQGRAAGTMATVNGVGLILAPLIGTGLYTLDPRVPYCVIGALLIVLMPWPARRSPA
ncbi:MAG: MFS transporter [Labilithrix sp.]|nr:MFS transporter [Labilithrix sp.]